jgi:hypothetical protein
MTRKVVIPQTAIFRAAYGPVAGRALLMPVQVDWPELQLSEQQRFENSLWRSLPHRTTPIPHHDHSIFDVELPYLDPRVLYELRKERLK